ncbi:MAG: Nudix-related transcriptional regulator NrtR [uncultured Quadrisphaera sp.]|uniref:Nudix-related transcriptional regulator NrtR n=1 Tax=uncultured Quadrisphaera sp. TaxID=904978 RepID=A0A6J4NJ54_9ACTN|nr:MAG: Nudix-related transcriptional regulator NrtR [uncultured Quadrisphaera sp.]
MGQGIDVAVSTVILALLPTGGEPGDGPGDEPGSGPGGPRLHLPLVRRTREPHRDCWALPGGWVRPEESLADAGRRTLAETTGLRPSYLEQLYTFGRPDRSPTGRVVSVVYTALVRSREAAAAQEGENVRWSVADDATGLAFDHDEVVRYALWRLRTKIEYGSIARHFIGERFSLSQLREVHESVLQRRLDPANFRRAVEASGTVEPTDERLTGGRHRPPRLYRAVPAPHGAAPPWEGAGPPA